MTEKAKNILIGLFLIAAVTIVVSMILFLEPKIGDGKKYLHVRFANIAGIVVGTRVTFAGKPVGEVLHIREIEDARSQADETGRVYCYELVLKTDSSVEVYDTDEIALRSTGLMGEKSVAILPKAGKSAQIITDRIIYANSVDPLENTFNQVAKTANRLEEAIAHFDLWFQENNLLLKGGLQRFNSVLSNADSLLGSLEQEKIVPLFRETVSLFNENLRSIRYSLVDDQLLHKITVLAEHLDVATHAFNLDGAPALHNLHQILQDVADGSGSVGQILKKDDFYLRISSLLSKADTMMNDINHYGFLFQYDKHWQRSRTKRANFLKDLASPQEFRAYFEHEIDTMITSLGRLSQLLERSEILDEKDRVVEQAQFKKQFAILLRSSQSLTESIKLYNENLKNLD